MSNSASHLPGNGWTAEKVFEEFAKGAIQEADALNLLSRLSTDGDSSFHKKNGNGAHKSSNQYSWKFTHGNSFLADHRVGGRDVVVAALYLTLAEELFRRKAGQGRVPFALENLEVLKMIDAAEGETVEITASLSDSDGKIEWQTQKSGAGPWAQSANARVTSISERPPRRNISPLLERLEPGFPGAVLYDPLYRKPGFQLGRSFQNVTKLAVVDDEIFVQLKSTLDPNSEFGTRSLDPTLVYGSHFSILYLHPLTRRSIYLPVSAAKISVYAAVRENCFAVGRVVRVDSETAIHDIDILDQHGEVCVRIEGLRSVNTKVPFIVERPASEPPLPAAPASKEHASANGSNANGRSNTDESALAAAIEDYIIDKLKAHLSSTIDVNAFRTAHFMEMGLGSTQLIGMTREVESEIGIELYPTLFFEYQNLRELSAYFAGEHRQSFERFLNQRAPIPVNNDDIAPDTIPAPARFDISISETSTNGRHAIPSANSVRDEDIAIIGMAGRFAQSPNLGEFWKNMVAGKHLVGQIPKNRLEWDSLGADAKDVYCQWGSFLEDVDRFDALFFKISPIEAEMMDPQLRLLLEVLYEASEDAAYAARLRGSRTGLYVGACSQDYYQNLLVRRALGLCAKPAATLSNLPFVLANRPSFIFDLQGPSFAVDTACSSSLVALHLACKSLRNGECDMAFAAGVNLILNPYYHAGLCSMGALTRSGACHTFDSKADGYVRGEGVAAVLLKPLRAAIADHDNIHAVVKATHLNHGGHSNSFSAPRPELQARLLSETWKLAEIEPDTIGYLDAHGTGTQLGDPIEVQAINRAFKQFTQKKAFCALGSVKAHIGHTEAAAGLAGVLKTVLCLKNRLIPRMPLFEKLNPFIDLKDSPLSIRPENVPWAATPGIPRRGCVSSFGIGGANAHVVLEEFNPPPPTASISPSLHRNPCVFPFSAQTREQLHAQLARMRDWLVETNLQNPDSIAHTLQIGRESFSWRAAFLAESNNQLRDLIQDFLDGKPADNKQVFESRKKAANGNGEITLTNNNRPTSDNSVAAVLAADWTMGKPVNWKALSPPNAWRPVSLPTYPFATTRYWYPKEEAQNSSQSAVKQSPASAPHADTKSHFDSNNPAPRFFTPERPLENAAPNSALERQIDQTSTETAPPVDGNQALEYLKNLFAREFKIPLDKFDPDEPFESFGLDSLLITRFNAALEDDLGPISKTLFFEHRTPRSLAQYFALHNGQQIAAAANANPPDAPATISLPNQAPLFSPPQTPRPATKVQDIAIIGVAGRYPEARDLDVYWDNLINGRDCIREIPLERWDYRSFYDPQPGVPGKIYCKWGGFLKDANKFDAPFFNITPREAAYMDPQERLFLETAWATFEDAGYTRKSLAARWATAGKGVDVGVFVGVTWNSYQLLAAEHWARNHTDAVTASTWSVANRVSFFFDFAGPSVSIDTACSSSLVAIHQACESIRRGDCRMALAGGVNLYLHPLQYISLCRARFLSTDGKCRSFGAGGDGFIPGEGVGAILLKPLDEALDDRDNIWGVIKGSAVNHGGRTHGYTVPNPDAQAALIRESFKRAGISPQTINCIEAHGTGTALGDPVEVSGLAKAFHGVASHSCALGSVKSNIGHLESAAGIAGITKVLLQMRHRRLAPTLHAQTPNPNITFDGTPLYLNHSATPWRSVESLDSENPNPLRAGISSFGAGGVNAHVILESPRQQAETESAASACPNLIVLSAQNPQSLRAYQDRLRAHLETAEIPPRLQDIAWTLQVGREPMEFRQALVVDSILDLIRSLSASHPDPVARRFKRPRIAFRFLQLSARPAGNGAPSSPVQKDFRQALERLGKLSPAAASVVTRLETRFPDFWQSASERAASYVWQCALAESWKALGIIPDVVIGDGAGEFAARCASGVFSMEDGLRLAADPEKAAQETEAQKASLHSSTLADSAAETSPDHWKTAADIVIEIGDASSFNNRVDSESAGPLSLSSFAPDGNEPHSFLKRLGQLFQWGVQPEWTHLNSEGRAKRISLPTCQFQGSSFSQFQSFPAVPPPSENSPAPSSPAPDVPNVAASSSPQSATPAPAPLAEFRSVAEPDRESWMLTFLTGQIAAVTQADPSAIAPSSRWQDLAMDSIMVMELVSRLQQAFDLMLYPREVYETPDVASLSKYLTQELARSFADKKDIPESRNVPADLTTAEPADSPLSDFNIKKSDSKKLPGIIFVLSSPRSGSTLLRVMLAGHPGLFSPPELHLLSFASMGQRQEELKGSHLEEGLQRAFMDAQGVEAAPAKHLIDDLCAKNASIDDVYALLQKQIGNRILVDKSPTYGLDSRILKRAEALFDHPRYIYLIRHPAAVIESSVRMRMQRLAGKTGQDPHRAAEQLWESINRNILNFSKSVDTDRFFRIRYEDLVAQPELQMRALCQHLKIPFADALLRPYEGKRMTDGVHSRSMPIGDPNFSKHTEISTQLADSWKNVQLPAPLQPATLDLCRQFRYETAPDAALDVAPPPPPSSLPPGREMIERWVTVRGVRLCVCTWGGGSGSAIWLLHGLLEQGAAWAAVASKLAARGYRVFAPDLRGHGLSDHATAGCGYHLADFLADLEGLARVLSPGSFNLVGHSFGSIIATLFSSARAAAVDRLILVEPILPPKNPPVSLGDQLASYLDRSSHTLNQPLLPDLSTAAARLKQGIPSLSDKLAARLALRLTEPCEGGLKWRWDPRLRSRTSVEIAGTWLNRADYLGLLEPHAGKLTCVYGDRGLNRSEDKMDSRANDFPVARSMTLPGGHHLHFDSPEELADLIHSTISDRS
jgi:acyl transferase domain-containing protein/pimeloyl-ACP methyl ester carboxylesterase/acyl carrier protein